MEIKINGLNNLMKMADRYPAISEKYVNRAIQRSLIRIQDKAKVNAPFGTTGQLKNNWNLRTGRFQGSLSSNAQSGGYYYGTAVEFGTKPHFPPVDKLTLWAKRKGMNPYVLAKSISRKGTKANPFFSKSIKSSESDIDKEFERALDDILKEI